MITVICQVNRALIFPEQQPTHDHGNPIGPSTASDPP
jgi:hypothetical protein